MTSKQQLGVPWHGVNTTIKAQAFTTNENGIPCLAVSAPHSLYADAERLHAAPTPIHDGVVPRRACTHLLSELGLDLTDGATPGAAAYPLLGLRRHAPNVADYHKATGSKLNLSQPLDLDEGAIVGEE